jgi:hypothetical protein
MFPLETNGGLQTGKDHYMIAYTGFPVVNQIWLFVTCYGSIGGHKSTKSLSGKRLN